MKKSKFTSIDKGSPTKGEREEEMKWALNTDPFRALYRVSEVERINNSPFLLDL